MHAHRQLVVGAAVVRDGRMLAARRVRPDSASGRWELPGGKVEAGEDPAAALVREIREELGCTIRVTGRLPGDQAIDERFALRVLVAELCSGEPVPHEHDALRWLGPEQLDDVDWLDPDRPFLPALRSVLAGAVDVAREADAGAAPPFELPRGPLRPGRRSGS